MNVEKIQKLKEKFPQLEIDQLVDSFNKLDTKKSGSLVQNEAMKLVQNLPEKYGFDQINQTYKKHVTGGMEIDEFVEVVAALKQQGVQKGSSADPELAALVNYINEQLQNDADLQDKLPFSTDSSQIFEETKSGLVLAKLINTVNPNSIDISKLHKGTMTAFQRTENQNQVINIAKNLGCNVGATDLEGGNSKPIIGFLQALYKQDMQNKVSIKKTPELIRLAQGKEDQTAVTKLKVEDLLMRWINYHVERANVSRFCNSLDKDLRDGELLTALFKQINPTLCDNQPMREMNTEKRMLLLQEYASKLGLSKFNRFLDQDVKAQVAFLANLFQLKHNILPLDQNEYCVPNQSLFESQGDRSLQSFTIWLNSFGYQLNNAAEELQDGLILAQILDKIVPGCVEWKRINKNPSSRIKKLENANYVCETAKKIGAASNLGGNDLADGNKPLLLAFLTKLQQISMEVETKRIGNGDLLAWANKFAQLGGSKEQLTSFKDLGLNTSRFYLHVMSGMNKRIVHWPLVQEGFGDEQKKDNAKYAISVALHLGVITFVGPEDLVEIKSKMVVNTYVDSTMVSFYDGSSTNIWEMVNKSFIVQYM